MSASQTRNVHGYFSSFLNAHYHHYRLFQHLLIRHIIHFNQNANYQHAISVQSITHLNTSYQHTTLQNINTPYYTLSDTLSLSPNTPSHTPSTHPRSPPQHTLSLPPTHPINIPSLHSVRRMCIWRRRGDGGAGDDINPWDMTQAMPRGRWEQE